MRETSWRDKTRPKATEIVNKQPRVSNRVKIRSSIFAPLLVASRSHVLPDQKAEREHEPNRRTSPKCSSCTLPASEPDCAQTPAHPGPRAALSSSMFTITPPTGIPKSWNQPMNREITAMGSASGNVTKKNAVFCSSVSRCCAWSCAERSACK